MVDGVVIDIDMVVTRSSGNLGSALAARPTGHKRVDNPSQPPYLQISLLLAAANFHAKHGFPVGELSGQGTQPNDDWKFVKSEFQMISPQHSIGGRVDVDLFTDTKPRHVGNSQRGRYHSIEDDAFGHPWTGANFNRNPVYSVDFSN